MVSSLVHASGAKPPKMKMTTDIPSSVTVPDKVKTSIGTLKYFDGVPTDKTVETVYDYLDQSRAVTDRYSHLTMNHRHKKQVLLAEHYELKN